MSKIRKSAAGLSLVAIISLGLGACGNDDSDVTTTTTAAGQNETSVAGSKPEVTVPDSPPPDDLQVRDIKVGTGPEAKAGSTVSAHYVGVSYSTKQEFDSSWDGGKPFTFTLGAGNVIKGWDEGIVGMREGGQRELVIPPRLGYGETGAGSDIGPNETLVFIVDLVSVR